jgi:type IV pilus assembly protein PilB
MSQRVRLGELLVDARIITREQLDEVLQRQETDPRRLGILLVEAGLLTETEVTQILSQQLSVPWVSLYHVDFSRQLLNLVPQQLAERYCVVPIFVRRVRGLGQTLYIAMDDPSDEVAIAAVTEYSGLPVRTMIAPPSEIRAAIRAYYSASSLRPVQAAPDRPSVDRGATSTSASAEPVASTVRAPSSPAKAAPGGVVVRDPLEAAAAPRAYSEEHAAEQTGPEHVVSAPPPADPSPTAAAMGTAVAPVETPALGRPNETDHGASSPRTQPSVPSRLGSLIGAMGAAATQDAQRGSGIGESGSVNSRRVGMPEPRRGAAHRMITVTLLDGTEIKLPARSSSAEGEEPASGEQLTARDMVAALRAAVHGADASEILGDHPRWERLVAALLALLLRKHLVADWEFIEEYNNLGNE